MKRQIENSYAMFKGWVKLRAFRIALFSQILFFRF